MLAMLLRRGARIVSQQEAGDGTHPRPFERAFYEDLRLSMFDIEFSNRQIIRADGNDRVIAVRSGQIAVIRLIEAAQVVNLFVYNPADPDERLWVHETGLIEGVYLRRYSRLWGTMAKFRPLLTVLDESVVGRHHPGDPPARHHWIFGGWGTPRDWREFAGDSDVRSVWEQIRAALVAHNVSPSIITDDVCLFQKTAWDPVAHRATVLRSDAVKGDWIAFFAEMDVHLVLALSPYGDGARERESLSRAEPASIAVDLTEWVREPLGWPYPEMAYPDLSLYEDERGRRTSEPTRTRGLHG